MGLQGDQKLVERGAFGRGQFAKRDGGFVVTGGTRFVLEDREPGAELQLRAQGAEQGLQRRGAGSRASERAEARDRQVVVKRTATLVLFQSARKVIFGALTRAIPAAQSGSQAPRG